jgi:hypothetical protein
MASSLGQEQPFRAVSEALSEGIFTSSPPPSHHDTELEEMQVEATSPTPSVILPPFIHLTRPENLLSSDPISSQLPLSFGKSSFSASTHRQTHPNRKRGHPNFPDQYTLHNKNPRYNLSPDQPTNPQEASSITTRELILEARDKLLQACSITRDHSVQSRLLDLLEIFREYTEKGKLHSASTIIASQVANLETATRQIEFKAKALAKAQPASLTTNQNSTPPSFATVASTNSTRTTSPQEWTLVEKSIKAPKKDPSPKNQKKPNRLILIKSPTGSNSTFSPLAVRNAFNKAFSDKGVKGPVVATVSKTLSQKNIVITTTSTFSADFLLENRSIWEHVIAFQSAQKDEPWHKVVLHGVPITDFNTPTGMDLVVEEITTFNKDLVPIGTPYWLTPLENRLVQRAGSVVVAFATANEASRAIRHRLHIAGISVRVEKLYSTASSTQCSKCQGFGHLDTYCKRSPICRLCGELHTTQQHKCNTCSAKGSKCVHLVPKCTNCKEAHTADFKSCEMLVAIKARKTSTTL